MKAGNRYFAGGNEKVAAYEVGKNDPVWEAKLEGTAASMLAADDRLFVVTDDNRLHCYGDGKAVNIVHHALTPVALPDVQDAWSDLATKGILQQEGTSEGFAIALGIGSGRLIDGLLQRSKLHIIAIDSDPEKVRAFRDRMTAANLYGTRCSAIQDDPLSANLPPYLANLIVSESITLNDAGLKTVFESLRPYGGKAVLGGPNQNLKGDDLAHATLRVESNFAILTREGALPESDDWTHQYGNAAQTAVSADHHVKAPFGVLWFGGPSHEGILPRHGHGPSPQVAGGRLFIEGPDMLRAVDVYTGRLLWEREMKGFGEYYDTTAHFPGAGEIGSNYVSLPDRVYAVYGDTILELDARNGESLRTFKLPPSVDGGPSPFWGHAVVSGDYLIATSSPVSVDEDATKKDKSEVEIVPRKALWKYLASDEKIANWESPNFPLTTEWKTGMAGFGYGDKDDVTVLDMRNKVSRVLIRHSFDSQLIPQNAVDLSLKINFDDAFVAYLNGKEIARAKVKFSPDGKPLVSSHEASREETFSLSNWRTLVRPEKNVLAIAGYNTSLTSSDFTLDPVLVATRAAEKAKGQNTNIPTTKYSSGSRRLVVFNRKSGEQLWSREAAFNFRHNNIVADEGRLFCIDSMTAQRSKSLSRRGVVLKGDPALYALDLKTGRIIWEKRENVFGTFLNYSKEHDVLVQGGSAYRDRAADEVGEGLMALRGSDGKQLWHHPKLEYHGPCLLWHDRILTNGASGFGLSLLTGEKTGFEFSRMYGCNTAIGSEHLMTFRSGAAGFYDLASNSGTGNLGGFKSSCTNNLIPANGVLNAPDYTRTCTCSYQNQTSLALIHMPEAEFWTFGGKANPNRIGINFGAPGDRASAEGTLFCEYPEVGGESDAVQVKVEGETLSYPRIHASLMKGDGPSWIAASAVEGVTRVVIDLPHEFREKQCALRLWFAEQDEATESGTRVFHVLIDGEKRITGLDIASESGCRRILTKKVGELRTGSKLELEFIHAGGSESPLLSGIEIVRI